MGSSNLGLRCLRSLHNRLDSRESLLPRANLLLDGLPFLQLDFTEHVTLDDNHLVLLVNLRVNDLVLDGFDRPELNFFDLNLRRGETENRSRQFYKMRRHNLNYGDVNLH